MIKTWLADRLHDPGRVMLRRAARVAVVQPLTFVFVADVLHWPFGTAFASFACFGLLAIADFGGPLRDRALAYLAVGAVGFPLIVIGSLVSRYLILGVVVAGVLAFAVTYAGVLRGYVAAATVPLLLPFVLALTSPFEVSAIGQRLAGWTIGVLASTVGALVLWPSHTRSELRSSVSRALRVAGRVVADGQAIDGSQRRRQQRTQAELAELAAAAEQVHRDYDGILIRPGGATRRDRALMLVVDELDRLKRVLAWESASSANSMPPDQQLAGAICGALNQAADSLIDPVSVPSPLELNQVREDHQLRAAAWTGEEFAAGRGLAASQRLESAFRLRIVALSAQSIAANVTRAVGHKVTPAESAITLGGNKLWDPVESPGVWHYLRAQWSWSSPWLRNSIRAGLAVALAVLIVLLTDVEHGFWVILGTLVALRFDASGTGRAAWQILVGTVGGSVAGLAIVFFFTDHRPVLYMLLPITVFLAAYTPGSISLAVGQGSFTAFAITMFALYAPDRFTTAGFRLLDVVLALVVSLVASALLWPRGVKAIVRQTMQRAAVAAGDYLLASFDRLVVGPTREPDATQARETARDTYRVASETFDLAVSQGDPGMGSPQEWALRANTIANFSYASGIVMSVARNGRSTGGDVGSQQAFIATAAELRDRLAREIAVADVSESRPGYAEAAVVNRSAGGLGPEDLPDLRSAIRQCMLDWQRNPPADLGIRVTSLIWLQDWVLYVNWLTDQLAPRSLAAEVS